MVYKLYTAGFLDEFKSGFYIWVLSWKSFKSKIMYHIDNIGFFSNIGTSEFGQIRSSARVVDYDS